MKMTLLSQQLVRVFLGSLALAIFLPANLSAQTHVAHLFNPHWSIVIDDYGYSDLAFDQRPGFEGREYLSGEWAAAIAYTEDGFLIQPTWLNPIFIFPDWDSNSDFGAETGIALSGQTNAWGFPIYRSVIANSPLRIGIESEMIDTTNGIPQGMAPRTAATGSNVVSDRYVFRQTFSITNISSVTLTSVKFFKFLHSLEATSALYDDRAYPGTFNGHRYVISQKGVSGGFTFPGFTPVMHSDVVGLHASLPPNAWEVGYYGMEPFDDHITEKPSVGVHLSVEADALSGVDDFAPAEKWVSGAVRQAIGTLAPNASTTLEYLMTVRTDSSGVPLRISRSGNDAVLSWPVVVGDIFWLSESDNITSTNWDYVFEPVVVQGMNNTVTVPIQPGGRFFKLGF